MRLSLIKPGLSAAAAMRHPHTGEVLEPLGYTKRGMPIWPVMGASPDDQGDAGDGGQGAGKDGDAGAGKDGDAGNGHDDSVEGLKARIAALEEEKNRHYGKRTQAEKELDELRKFKADLENANKTDLEKTQSELATVKADLEALTKVNKDLTIRNAFLSNNKITWHNPDEALRLADLSAVEVKADGTVDAKALEAALTNLANKSKHLVKSDDGGAGEGNGSGQGSGSEMNGQRKGEKGGDRQPPSREELAKRYPALNIR